MPEFSLITVGRLLLNSLLQVEILPIKIRAEARALFAQCMEALLQSLLVQHH